MPASPHFLLQHFDRLAEAPGGIAKLRALVLQLAVTGKLLPQSKSDEPAAKLLARIRAEKTRITKKTMPFASVDRSAVPVEIPAEWEWIKLGDLCSKTGSGSTPRGGKTAYTTSGIPFLRSQNVYDGGLRLDGVAYITPEIHAQMSGTAVVPGDLLLNITGGSIGRCAIVPDTFTEGNVSQHVAILRPAIAGMGGYLHLVVHSPHFQIVMLGSQTGAGREGLPKNRMDEILIPLPPLAEQRRIVAKVEELMGLCDALEAAQRKREAVRTRLRTSALHQLASPDSDSTPAAFILQNLPRLINVTGDIEQMRQTILAIATTGRLTVDWRNKNPLESVNRLLETRLRSESSRKIRRGVADFGKDGDKNAISFLPRSWASAPAATLLRAGFLIDLKDGNHGANHPRKDDFTESGLPFITAAQVDRFQIDYDGAYKISGVPLSKLKVGFSIPGDVIYTHKGSVGRVAINDRECVLSPQTTYYRVDESVLLNRYLMWFLASSVFADQIDEIKGQTTRDFVPITRQYSMLHAIPPLAEQRRIVAKVDELVAVLDALETALTTARTTAERLLSATVAKLYAA